MKKILTSILLILVCNLYAQKEANNWYFGYGAGLTFNSGVPVAMLGGQVFTHEGCSTMSDANGQLLFYTDGTTVYNRNHQVMVNGDFLTGNTSSSQSAVIVPLPSSTTIYYIFTVTAEAGLDGFRYSVVDLSLAGGLGEVTAQKNVLLYTPSCEKIAVVKHSNNNDYWIVTHGWNNNSFYSYLLTSAGLSVVPVTSTVGVNVQSTPGAIFQPSSRGCLKFSPDATKLVSPSPSSTCITQLLDFNNATGIISNPRDIQVGTNQFYGAEFSTNSEVLYLSSENNKCIYQFDLNNPNFVSTAVQLYSGPKGPFTLQLGPDGKIYIAFIFDHVIGAINNPSVLGLGCNFVSSAVDLLGRECRVGLPAFITTFFYKPIIVLDNFCQNEVTSFHLDTNQTINSVSWNFGDGYTSTAIQPIHIYTNAGNYSVSVNINGSNGTSTSTRNIIINSQPTLSSSVVNLKQCDDDLDGFSSFNLNESVPLLVSSSTGLVITFYETLSDAQNKTNAIINTTAYINQVVSNDIIYARVENSSGCFKTAQISLQVSTTLIPSTFQLTYHECDDLNSGTISDGIATFDFSNATSQIQALYPAGQQLNITYYKTITDALSESNKITNISNYTNIGYPNSEDIYVRVDSQVNNECLGLGHHITLKVDPIPIVQSQVVKHCDDDQDGLYGFDTTNLQTSLLNGLSNVIVTYKDQNGLPLSSPLPNPFVTSSQIINVKVENNYGKHCVYNSSIQFIVDDLPEAFQIPVTLTTFCDDESDPLTQDGVYPFDTTNFQSLILGGQTGMIVHYFDANNNPLPSPLPNPFNSTSQNIRVEVISPINTTCKANGTISLVVNPVPKINLYGNELVCSDNPNFTKTLNAGLIDLLTVNNYTYTWFLNGTLIPNANQYTLTVNAEGIYTVEVRNVLGCIRTRTITVTASNIATINSVEVTDISAENSILVLVSGSGNYSYSLDSINFQNDNLFTNILPGVYTVYVKDDNGCGIATKEVSVLGIPNYFTPNGDGYNDYWNIKGVNQEFNSKAIIYIFDRFGKLLKQISPNGIGWDGKFEGQKMPSEDYWYSIQLEDNRIIKGHFALKR